MPGWHKKMKEPEVLPPCATCGRTNVCPNCSSILARSPKDEGPVEPEGARAALEKIKESTASNISPEKFIHEIARAALKVSTTEQGKIRKALEGMGEQFKGPTHTIRGHPTEFSRGWHGAILKIREALASQAPVQDENSG